MPDRKGTTWGDHGKYSVTRVVQGGKLCQVTAKNPRGATLTFTISREACDRLPKQFDVGHVLAEGGTIA